MCIRDRDQSEITKAGGKSKLIVGTNKDKV